MQHKVQSVQYIKHYGQCIQHKVQGVQHTEQLPTVLRGDAAGLWDDGGPEGPGMGRFGRNSPQMGPAGFDPGSLGPNGSRGDLDVSSPRPHSLLHSL